MKKIFCGVFIIIGCILNTSCISMIAYGLNNTPSTPKKYNNVSYSSYTYNHNNSNALLKTAANTTKNLGNKYFACNITDYGSNINFNPGNSISNLFCYNGAPFTTEVYDTELNYCGYVPHWEKTTDYDPTNGGWIKSGFYSSIKSHYKEDLDFSKKYKDPNSILKNTFLVPDYVIVSYGNSNETWYYPLKNVETYYANTKEAVSKLCGFNFTNKIGSSYNDENIKFKGKYWKINTEEGYLSTAGILSLDGNVYTFSPTKLPTNYLIVNLKYGEIQAFIIYYFPNKNRSDWCTSTEIWLVS